MLKWLFNKIKIPREITKYEQKENNINGYLDLLSQLKAKARAEKKPTFHKMMAYLEEQNLSLLSSIEKEKLTAFAELYSGANAAAYERVRKKKLTENDYELLIGITFACYHANKYEEAAVLLKQFNTAQIKDAEIAEYLAFTGYMCLAAGEAIEDALKYYDMALNNGQFNLSLFINAYGAYFEGERHDSVLKLRMALSESGEDDPEAQYAAACLELARGYYPEGFRLLESRYDMPEAHRSINPQLLDIKRWSGELQEECTLLVHGEQGLGDTIMMCRYLNLFKQTKINIKMDCRPEMTSLLEHNFPGCQFIECDQRTPIETKFDAWTGIMSLPYHFKSSIKTIPYKERYLNIPEQSLQYWNERVVANDINRKSIKIGVAWSGNPSHKADRRRSMPMKKISEIIQRFPLIEFYSLQKNVSEIKLANFHDCSDELITMSDTAALISNMDAVVSVDTSVIHLAGALGKKSYLMLPKRYEWRWGLDGRENPWYESVDVLRQVNHGDWTSVVTEIIFILNKMAESKAPEIDCA